MEGKNLEKTAKLFGVEKRHYDKVYEITQGLINDFAILNTGDNREDCIRYKIAAEILGYEVENGDEDDRGYPYNYVLRKDSPLEFGEDFFEQILDE